MVSVKFFGKLAAEHSGSDALEAGIASQRAVATRAPEVDIIAQFCLLSNADLVGAKSSSAIDQAPWPPVVRLQAPPAQPL